jgi:hypothetical protein
MSIVLCRRRRRRVNRFVDEILRSQSVPCEQVQ